MPCLSAIRVLLFLFTLQVAFLLPLGCRTTASSSTHTVLPPEKSARGIQGTWILDPDATGQANAFIPAGDRDQVFGGLQGIDFKVNFSGPYYASQLAGATSYEAYEVLERQGSALLLGFYSRDGSKITRKTAVEARGNRLLMFTGPFIYVLNRAPDVVTEDLMPE